MEGEIMDQAVFKDVVKIITPYAKNADMLAKATVETNIHKDLQVNSTRFVDIVLEFEDKFGLTISDDEADKIQTIGDCVSLVSKLK